MDTTQLTGHIPWIHHSFRVSHVEYH